MCKKFLKILSAILGCVILISFSACAGNDNGMFDETKNPTVDSVQPDDDGKETEPENQEKEPEIQEREPELEHGFFEPKVGGFIERTPRALAYRSYTNEFDINNVTLRIYYGYGFNVDEEYARENYGFSCSEFEIYCYNCDFINFKHIEANRLTLKTVKENIVSDKYRIETEYDAGDARVHYTYSYSEEFTIPAELFGEDFNQLCIGIGGVNLKKYGGPEYQVIDFTVLNYELKDSKVKLTTYEYD